MTQIQDQSDLNLMERLRDFNQLSNPTAREIYTLADQVHDYVGSVVLLEVLAEYKILLDLMCRIKGLVDKDEMRSSICRAMDELWDYRHSEKTCKETAHILRNYVFPTWPKHSGNSKYPVPDPAVGHSHRTSNWRAADIYGELILHRGSPWLGSYGKLRYELLEHCIDWLTFQVHLGELLTEFMNSKYYQTNPQ